METLLTDAMSIDINTGSSDPEVLRARCLGSTFLSLHGGEIVRSADLRLERTILESASLLTTLFSSGSLVLDPTPVQPSDATATHC